MVMHKGIPDWSPLKSGVLITGRARQTSSSQRIALWAEALPALNKALCDSGLRVTEGAGLLDGGYQASFPRNRPTQSRQLSQPKSSSSAQKQNQGLAEQTMESAYESALKKSMQDAE